MLSDDPARLDELLDELATLTTEAAGSRADLDTLGTLELVREMNAEDAKVPAAVGAQAPAIAAAVDGIVGRMRRGGRLIYVGAGTAGRIGILDASECPPTFGTDPALVVGLIAGGPTAIQRAVENSEDDGEAAAAELAALGLAERDVVVGISASGRTPYVVGALQHARSVRRAHGGDRAERGVDDRRARRGADRGRRRPRAGRRVHPAEVRHGAEAGPQHAQHAGDGAAGQDLQRHHGRPAGHQRQAQGALGAHRHDGRRRGRATRRPGRSPPSTAPSSGRSSSC